MADDLLKLLISNPFCSDGRIAQRISLGSEGLDDVDAGGALEEEFGGDAEAAAEAERGKLETRRQKLEMGKSCATIRKTAFYAGGHCYRGRPLRGVYSTRARRDSLDLGSRSNSTRKGNL